ncbi:hypothetical protein [Nitrogeniibacter aestuarii]|uniref:hypothetical protein n=1 Tax=Nitrogeniibacter aestuarii TaxID=2815343 RepID=UPI001E4A7AEF|nr:hypothetical protein [Nitrogeniibacter aestuarii]
MTAPFLLRRDTVPDQAVPVSSSYGMVPAALKQHTCSKVEHPLKQQLYQKVCQKGRSSHLIDEWAVNLTERRVVITQGQT